LTLVFDLFLAHQYQGWSVANGWSAQSRPLFAPRTFAIRGDCSWFGLNVSLQPQRPNGGEGCHGDRSQKT
jgi:hypothetical protein